MSDTLIASAQPAKGLAVAGFGLRVFRIGGDGLLKPMGRLGRVFGLDGLIALLHGSVVHIRWNDRGKKLKRGIGLVAIASQPIISFTINIRQSEVTPVAMRRRSSTVTP